MMEDMEKRIEMFKRINYDFTPQERTALLVAMLEAVYPDEQTRDEFLKKQRKNYDAIDKGEKV